MRVHFNNNNGEEEYFSDSDSTSTTSSDSPVWDLSFNEQPEFGILFDVDGVLARGSNPLDPAVQAVKLLTDPEGNLRVPIAYVTNACNRSHDKAAQIQTWFNIPVSPDQVIHAPTPARLLTEYHDKHVLVVGQEYRQEIAKDIGFSKTCTIEDIREAYPFLDMVDHDNRKRVAAGSFSDNVNFPRVEAILMIGEPQRWESSLQLLIDLLLTEGKPTSAPTSIKDVRQLPIIACNMDLVFMAEACMPRFGHGAFLVCLEALYKKITGLDLDYTALIGKPCEITYRYAEHTIAAEAKKIGITRPIKKLYFIGDNPQVDIVGANLYDRFLKQNKNGNGHIHKPLPRSRSIPCSEHLMEQTVLAMESLLVGTGVYNAEKESKKTDNDDVYHGHRDIMHEPDLARPTRYVKDVYHGLQHILEQENFRVVT
ncbi:haloacid dehalogenase-like hydrolase domain-containing 5 isoform X1 [Mizuhopecten yessoensis]|uniref:haloacid dehalogenase-like hydrolase domain-containing 5 isoform X1 n=1 Tax=Mizuhopecten yessoensis TaxID=6573 RepID=UPI000B4594C3|nr:haloacid dehalogenase-like hydrolase domain-containing 5 isoform X1 [Mizuhopecten yessoensis]